MSSSRIGRTLTIFRINLLGIVASLFGATAWSIWPSTAEWWGLGVLSILFGLSAFHLLLQALGMAWRVWAQERAIAALGGFGREAKSSQMATTARLRQMGMIGD